MAAAGGVQGLLTGKASAGPVGSTAASADSTGRSSGEQGAEEATGNRFAKATQGAAGLLGPVGQAGRRRYRGRHQGGRSRGLPHLGPDQPSRSRPRHLRTGLQLPRHPSRSDRSPVGTCPAAHMSHHDDDANGDGFGQAGGAGGGGDGGSGPSGSSAGSSPASAPYLPQDPAFPQGSPLPGWRRRRRCHLPEPALVADPAGPPEQRREAPPEAPPGEPPGGAAGGAAAGTAAAVPIPPIA